MLRCALLIAALSALGCDAETLLQVNFEADALGSVPGPAQSVGTVTATEAGDARVRVVASPQPAVDADRWVRITRPAQLSEIPSLRGRLTQVHPDGRYLTTVQLFVPSGAGAATVQFEPQFGPELFGFFHVDFLPSGQVRLDDDPALVFGSFPHDQIFSLAVNLNVSAGSTTATVTLLGAASGSLERTLSSGQHNFARQFGAVRLWMGFPHTGSFFADDLVVLRSPP
jgi:hypothetical protein